MPVTQNGDPRTAELNRIIAYVDQKAGLKWANSFQAYAVNFPNTDPSKIYLAWLLRFVGSGLAKTLGNTLPISVAKTGQQVAEGTGAGLGQITKDLSVGGFLGLLTERNVLMRIGEGVLGVLLIVVGVAKLADGTPLGAALKKVPIVP